MSEVVYNSDMLMYMKYLRVESEGSRKVGGDIIRMDDMEMECSVNGLEEMSQ